MRRGRARRIVGAALAVALVAGCTGDGEPDDAAPAAPTTEAAAEPVWTLPLRLIGPPVVVADGVAAGLVRQGEGLAVVAIDTDAGVELWRRDTIPGPGARSATVRVRVLHQPDGDGVLLYVRRAPRGGDLAVSVVRPVLRTGEDMWVSEPLDATSGPEPCADGSVGRACTTIVAPSQGQTPRTPLDLSNGVVLEVTPPVAEVRGTLAGGELSHLPVEGREHIALLDDGGVVWQVDVEEVFGPRATADAGGWWQHDEEAGLFLGTAGTSRRADEVVDLTDTRMVALDDATGEIAWSDDGSTPACLDRLALARGPSGPGPALPLRCRSVGTAVFPVDVHAEVALTDLGVTLERYDPASGETVWHHDLGAQPSLPLRNQGVDRAGVGAVAGPRTSVLPIDGTPMLVDLVSGRTSRPDPGAVVACLTPAAGLAGNPVNAGQGPPPQGERVGDHLVVPCGTDLEPVDRPLPPEVVAAVGVPAGSVTLVAQQWEIVGYRS